MQALFDLSGKVAAVTGATSGIGRAIAMALASAGASVVGVGRRSAELDSLTADIEKIGGEASGITADLSSLDACGKIAGDLAEPFGPPQILVNAAGINPRKPWDQVTPEIWDKTLSLNLSIPFFLAKHLVGAMAEKGWGRIINIASLQSSRAFPDGAPYGASKGGVAQLTRAMAEAWSAQGINANAIAPGFFPTELTASLFDNDEAAGRLAANTAIGRNGRLEDLHGIAIFLAAPASDYITGQVIYVDGGFTAK